MGYSQGLIWSAVGDAFISSSIVCLLARGYRVAFGGLTGCPLLSFVESLVRAERVCI